MKFLRLLTFWGMLVQSVIGFAETNTPPYTESNLPLPGEFSFGVAAFYPTGITAKYWTTQTNAWDFFANWGTDDFEMDLHADYLIHDYNQFGVTEIPLAFYYGYGARLEYKDDNDDDTEVWLRIPLGLTTFLEAAPLELFGEVAPRLKVIPETTAGLDLMIGVRYRFRGK